MIWSQYRFRIILPASVKYILLDCDEQNDMGLELAKYFTFKNQMNVEYSYYVCTQYFQKKLNPASKFSPL